MLLVCVHTLVVIICLLEVYYCAQFIHRRIFRAAVFSAIGIIFGLVPIITNPWYERLSLPYESHLEAAWFVLAGTFFLSIGAMCTETFFQNNSYTKPLSRIKRIESVINTKAFYTLVMLAATLGLLGWFGTTYFSGASLTSTIKDGRLAFRGQGNTILVGISGHLFVLNYLVAFSCWLIRNPLLRMVIFCYALLLVAGAFLLTNGTRFESVAILIALASGYLLSHTLTASKALNIVSAGISVLAIAAIAVPLRHNLSTLQPNEILPYIFSTERLDPILTSDPLNYHDTVIRVIDAFPARYDFVNASTYRRILFFFIPSSLAPSLKPPDPNRTVAQALFGYETATSIDWMHPPGIFGDIWINFFGWNGCLMFLFWGGLLSYLGTKISQEYFSFLWIGPLLGCLTLLLIRGQPYQFFIKLLAAYLLISILVRITGLKRFIKNVELTENYSDKTVMRKQEQTTPTWRSRNHRSLQSVS